MPSRIFCPQVPTHALFLGLMHAISLGLMHQDFRIFTWITFIYLIEKNFVDPWQRTGILLVIQKV
jgi:hypothetical protein